ncbi:hypothetical protein Tco_0494734 [Tanacetum coccineum]
MLSLSLHAILHFSSLWMSLKCTCTSSSISCTSMTPSTDSRLTRRNDSSLLWKYSEMICLRVQGREFDPLPSEEDIVSFLRELSHTGRSIHSMMLLSIRCINPGEPLLLLSTGVYLERLVVLTSFVSPKLKSFRIENRVYKKQEKMYYPRFTKVIINHFLIQEKSLSWRNKIRMHTSKDDYLINSLRFVSAKESSQIYGAVLPECLTSPEIKESKAYKTYLGHATGVVPPKIARKFKKASPSKKDSIPIQADEELIHKGKRVKRSAKKSSTTPAAGIVFRETPVKTKSTRKERVDVLDGKGIDLLYEVALAEKAQLKEVRKKSLRDFHKTHPSGSGTVSKIPLGVEKITPTVTGEGTGDKPGVPDVTDDDSTKSESESWGNDEDENNNEQEASDKDSGQENESEEQESDLEQDEESNDDNQEEEEVDQENESEDDEIESDEDKGIDDTIDQFDDDVDARFEEPTQTGKEVVQSEGADVEMNEAQQGNENLETTQEQVVDDAHVTITTVMKKTKVPVTFFRFNDRITTLEKEVAKLKKDPLHTQVTTLVDEHLDISLGETIEEFMNFLSESLTARIKEQVKDQLRQILPKEVSNFAPPIIEKLIKESRDEVTLAKVSSQPQSTYEAASTLTEFELKKIHLNPNTEIAMMRGRKDKDKDEDPSAGSDRGLKKRKLSKDADIITGLKNKDSTSGSSKGTYGKSIQSEEPVFEVVDSDMPQDQEGNRGDNEDEPRNKTASRRDWFKKLTPPQEPTDLNWNIGKTTPEGPTQNWLITLAASTSTDKSLKDFDELMSTTIDFSSYVLNGLKIENLTQEVLLGPAFRLLKGTRSNYAELEYDFEECYKALSEKLDWENPKGGDYPFDLSKPLPLITRGKRQRVPFEFFINNDLKYLQGGISTMTYTTSTTKTKAAKYDLPGIEDMVPNIWSPVKVAYDRYALWGISHWRQQRKSFYAYARGIQSRGDVYSTKRILAVTHVKVMRKHGYGYLEEIVVRRADNVLYRFKKGNDVADFAIALRMFTRSLVIQKRVEDLQHGVESYQKKINVTKPDTTRPDLRKRHPTAGTKVNAAGLQLLEELLLLEG